MLISLVSSSVSPSLCPTSFDLSSFPPSCPGAVLLSIPFSFIRLSGRSLVCVTYLIPLLPSVHFLQLSTSPFLVTRLLVSLSVNNSVSCSVCPIFLTSISSIWPSFSYSVVCLSTSPLCSSVRPSVRQSINQSVSQSVS